MISTYAYVHNIDISICTPLLVSSDQRCADNVHKKKQSTAQMYKKFSFISSRFIWDSAFDSASKFQSKYHYTVRTSILVLCRYFSTYIMILSTTRLLAPTRSHRGCAVPLTTFCDSRINVWYNQFAILSNNLLIFNFIELTYYSK